MVQRITGTLVEAGLASQNERSRKYVIGHAALRLGNAYLKRTGLLLQRCIAELPRLTDETGETTSIHRRIGQRRIIVAQYEGTQDLSWRSDTSKTYPLNAGAASKALLSCLPPKDLSSVLDSLEFEQYQRNTPCTKPELEAQVLEVRSSGIAISFGERIVGAGGIAAPVTSAAEGVSLAICVYGPEVRMRPAMDKIVQAVRAAAKRATDPDSKET
jgi:DNA-binding IclR family transcriptional regulator